MLFYLESPPLKTGWSFTQNHGHIKTCRGGDRGLVFFEPAGFKGPPGHLQGLQGGVGAGWRPWGLWEADRRLQGDLEESKKLDALVRFGAGLEFFVFFFRLPGGFYCAQRPPMRASVWWPRAHSLSSFCG